MFHDWQSREVLVDGRTVHVNTLMCKLGRIHKRISVEMTLQADGGILRADTPFEYFERYQSGRFYPSPREQARQAALLKGLPYVLLGVVVIALLAIVWYFLLRGR